MSSVERKRTLPVLRGVDRDWGYEFGSDGTLNDSQAAELLGCTRTWVWKLGKRGLLRRGKDKSGRWYYCKRSLTDYRKVEEYGPG